MSFLKLFSVLKKAFEAFDQEKKGCIGTVMVGTILGMLGHQVSDATLKEIIDEVDADGKRHKLLLLLLKT